LTVYKKGIVIGGLSGVASLVIVKIFLEAAGPSPGFKMVKL
jgi:hypothetical protein